MRYEVTITKVLIGSNSQGSQPPETGSTVSASASGTSRWQPSRTTRSDTSSGITYEVGRLFGLPSGVQPNRKHPTFCSGRQSARARGKKKKTRTWSKDFICLSRMNQQSLPTISQHAALRNAAEGLVGKSLFFHVMAILKTCTA